MFIEKYKPIWNLLLISFVAFLVHKWAFEFFKINEASLFYSLEMLYLFFFNLSILIFFILIKVKQKSFDNVGMTFMLITSIKVVICYVVLKPILMLKSDDLIIDKINYFGMFILFLAIEVVLTVRILNEKQ